MNVVHNRLRVTIVYESMFGATGRIAEEIAATASLRTDVSIVVAERIDPGTVLDPDLLMIGAPTHAFGLSSGTTRREAQRVAANADLGLSFEPNSLDQGVRELLPSLKSSGQGGYAAAFDTRIGTVPRLFSGSAGRHIDRELHALGYRALVPPRSFLVDRTHHLLDGQLEEAATWADEVIDRLIEASARG